MSERFDKKRCELMNNLTQHRSRILGTHGRVAGAAVAIAIMLVPAVLATGSAQAQTYTERVLYSFKGGGDGAEPLAGLVRDAQGNLYGTTGSGGAYRMERCSRWIRAARRRCSTASPGLGETAQVHSGGWCGTRRATCMALPTTAEIPQAEIAPIMAVERCSR